MSSALYLWRSAARRSWRPLVVLALLGGVLGAVALAAVAGAWRTDTAYGRYLRAANVSDAPAEPGTGGAKGARSALRTKSCQAMAAAAARTSCNDGGDVGVGRAVVDDAGAEGKGTADAGVGQADAATAGYLPQNRGVALVRVPGAGRLPAEAHGAELDRRQQLQRGLGGDEPGQQPRAPQVLADRLAELAEPVVAQ